MNNIKVLPFVSRYMSSFNCCRSQRFDHRLAVCSGNVAILTTIESFRFEDENEDEDEDEALCFRHKEIFKLFRLQLGRDNVVAINFVVPAKLKTKKFEDFVVVKTEYFVLVLDFVLVLESKALY